MSKPIVKVIAVQKMDNSFANIIQIKQGSKVTQLRMDSKAAAASIAVLLTLHMDDLWIGSAK